MLQKLPSKFFKELEGLLGHMWPSVVLDKHYTFESLFLRLFLMICFSLSNELQYHSALTVAPRCSQSMSRGPSSPLSTCNKFCEACYPSARRNWIITLCADLEESIMQRSVETTLQK
ncbi:hypothetical protein AVEN_3321-1 [Araneus ventricosus]|uniref:Uncharacterized protein n=1 Tax=Araneus ventricosus TaxID=182803 RepID=A0A4Y2JA91_ARAVE|nr:hypothetical protein AVEN_3321-1 [Araneus ventricosus]